MFTILIKKVYYFENEHKQKNHMVIRLILNFVITNICI